MKLKFLMAEEFREEANNKISALGIFPGDSVILLKGLHPKGVPDNVPVALERLSFLVAISELTGSHNYRGDVIDPSGSPAKKELPPLGKGIVIAPGMSHTFVVEMKPFVIGTPGVYKFILYVDDKPHEFPFEIRTQ